MFCQALPYLRHPPPGLRLSARSRATAGEGRRASEEESGEKRGREGARRGGERRERSQPHTLTRRRRRRHRLRRREGDAAETVAAAGVAYAVAAVAAVAAHSYDQWDSSGARPLCHFELPSEAKCSLQAPTNGTCQIHQLPPHSCFENWPDCKDNTSFMENINFSQNFDEDNHTTTLEIYDYKETRLLIVRMLPEETWWQVDVPKGEHNITITGLLGSLNETIQLFNTVYCEGCPPPRVTYIAKPHKFEIKVSPSEDQNSIDFVSVYMASTNETDFIRNNKCNNPELYLNRKVHGKANESLVFEDVFSTEFCFLIKVNWTKKERPYRCSLQQNMTEPPFRPVRAPIEPPVWWVAGIIILIILLALTSLVPLAIQKGLLRRR